MAGTGAGYVLDKGFNVLSTYNTSNAAGVEKYRCVAFGAGGTIDLNGTATTTSVGVVQDSVDRAKVATGKAVAPVRVLGVSRVIVDTATSLVLGSRVQVGATGGVALAATTNKVVGIIVGAPTTIAAGNIVEVLLTPGAVGA